MSLLEIRNLKKHFPVGEGLFSRGKGAVKAVDGVNLSINEGETLGLVGESGCGKSTLGRTILRLIEPTSGEINFLGKNLLSLSNRELRDARRDMQIIFQDPYASLNPRMRVGDIVGEGLEIHKLAKGKARRERVMELLHQVGLREDHYDRYPHEFSGGQRQRIGIARALAVNPKFIVCDEPVSSLDVSIQAQIINLLQELQEKMHLTYLFISHDLRVVEHISHRVAIMYLGKVVEIAKSDTIYRDAKHPYTRALLSAVPIPDMNKKKERVILEGDVPSPVNPPPGCTFHPRCSYREAICSQTEPPLEFTPDGHGVSCHVFGPGARR
ncbi:MAG TPA: dipeptide ABC transporter ATP-binding protein [Candidatus Binatia bacterium]|jgi:oligopeptide transport system ATP-binding protein|nr:dipeptide ABC transporter ATP-binding protein [Candidatus Binatia bacterium]